MTVRRGARGGPRAGAMEARLRETKTGSGGGYVDAAAGAWERRMSQQV